MLYVKVIWPDGGHLLRTAEVIEFHEDSNSVLVNGREEYSRADFSRVYVMSETGATIDKIRGLGDATVLRQVEIEVVPGSDLDREIVGAETLVQVPSHGTIPKDEQVEPRS